MNTKLPQPSPEKLAAALSKFAQSEKVQAAVEKQIASTRPQEKAI